VPPSEHYARACPFRELATRMEASPLAEPGPLGPKLAFAANTALIYLSLCGAALYGPPWA
jgi:hypothetical protein